MSCSVVLIRRLWIPQAVGKTNYTIEKASVVVLCITFQIQTLHRLEKRSLRVLREFVEQEEYNHNSRLDLSHQFQTFQGPFQPLQTVLGTVVHAVDEIVIRYEATSLKLSPLLEKKVFQQSEP